MRKDKLSTKKSDASDGAFIGPDGLTQKRRDFVGLFINGKTAGNALRSAIAAGYSEKTAGAIACGLLKEPPVQAAIDAALRAELSGSLTTNAIRVIRNILADENAPLKLRGDMAAKVVEFSGIVGRVAVEKGRETGLDAMAAGPKRLGEMTRGELENLVRDGAMILQAAASLPPIGQALDAKAKAPSTDNSHSIPFKAAREPVKSMA